MEESLATAPQNRALSLVHPASNWPIDGAGASAGAVVAGGGTGGGGGREDCWSEGATLILIEAWGDRYLDLNRGNLRQKHWKDVADIVNGRQDGTKPRKTDVQCKNRLDTLKKKYKLEKSKLQGSTAVSSSVKWPYYYRLDELIGPYVNKKTPIIAGTAVPATPLVKSQANLHHPSSVTFTVKPLKEKRPAVLNAVDSGGSTSKSRESPGTTESSPNDSDGVRRRGLDGGGAAAFRDLARAILKFGEIYEKIESSKQQLLMELEKQRMEFTKELEFQRMQMFMEARLELEKVKRPKHAGGTGLGAKQATIEATRCFNCYINLFEASLTRSGAMFSLGKKL